MNWTCSLTTEASLVLQFRGSTAQSSSSSLTPVFVLNSTLLYKFTVCVVWKLSMFTVCVAWKVKLVWIYQSGERALSNLSMSALMSLILGCNKNDSWDQGHDVFHQWCFSSSGLLNDKRIWLVSIRSWVQIPVGSLSLFSGTSTKSICSPTKRLNTTYIWWWSQMLALIINTTQLKKCG